MLNLIPGADMMFVITTAAGRNARAGVKAALGIGTGTLVHIVVSVVGLAALLAAEPLLYRALRIAGALYLIWIAYSLVRPKQRGGGPAEISGAGGRPFVTGILINVTNPKVALFFVAFLPQFTTRGLAHPAVEMLCLGLWFNLVGTGVNCLVALSAARVSKLLNGHAALGKAFKWTGALMLAGIGASLALNV
ncbi:LysE family translocator [Sphingomonas panacisoli]|uniref:LysE family translocator n=1 Tax=Sphingomonas panacisoli TaxID=1813879 RepID=A0A5B8LEW6_9SPHN|nr:LysE family translocator [Sphingomonas panacisoli]QDZ06717.1 LysE family translocator [Sphingomonas panacisoli]